MLIAELDTMTQEWNCTRRETMLEILYMFYENEFPMEYLKTEFEPMSDEELLEAYLNIRNYPQKCLILILHQKFVIIIIEIKRKRSFLQCIPSQISGSSPSTANRRNQIFLASKTQTGRQPPRIWAHKP